MTEITTISTAKSPYGFEEIDVVSGVIRRNVPWSRSLRHPHVLERSERSPVLLTDTLINIDRCRILQKEDKGFKIQV